jgi:hypothetical protein
LGRYLEHKAERHHQPDGAVTALIDRLEKAGDDDIARHAPPPPVKRRAARAGRIAFAKDNADQGVG